MKLFGSIFLLNLILALVSDSYLEAQGTKVVKMQARVVIAPGATVNEVQPFTIDLKERSSSTGQISFNTSKFAQTKLVVKKSVVLNNEYGDSIIMKFDEKYRKIGYEQYVEIDSSFSQLSGTMNRGNFKGELPITIFYN